MSNQELHRILSPSAYAIACALKEIKQEIPDELRSIFSFSLPVVSCPVSYKFGWLASLVNNSLEFNTVKLKLLHHFFLDYQYIPEDTPYEEFESHFINNKSTESQLKWTGKNYVLPKLFDKLRRKNIISFSGNLCEMLCLHFKDSDGKQLKKSSLENQLGRNGSPEEDNNMSNIIEYMTC